MHTDVPESFFASRSSLRIVDFHNPDRLWPCALSYIQSDYIPITACRLHLTSCDPPFIDCGTSIYTSTSSNPTLPCYHDRDYDHDDAPS
jgi:hypothetical protein